MASIQIGENIGQNVALKMMQKQIIAQSGGFPYLQMEKEVYYCSKMTESKNDGHAEFSDSEKLWFWICGEACSDFWNAKSLLFNSTIY